MLQEDIMNGISQFPDGDREIVMELLSLIKDDSNSDRIIRERIANEINSIVTKEQDQ